MPNLIVNGEERDFTESSFPKSIAELVGLLGLSTQSIVAEVDGEIVVPSEFESPVLAPGCRVELVRMVGGG